MVAFPVVVPSHLKRVSSKKTGVLVLGASKGAKGETRPSCPQLLGHPLSSFTSFGEGHSRGISRKLGFGQATGVRMGGGQMPPMPPMPCHPSHPAIWPWFKANGIPFWDRCTTHFSLLGIGMFTGGTIWVLTHGHMPPMPRMPREAQWLRFKQSLERSKRLSSQQRSDIQERWRRASGCSVPPPPGKNGHFLLVVAS